MDIKGEHPSALEEKHPSSQELFARVRPWLVVSCASGLGAGFLLAAIFSVTLAPELPLGLWRAPTGWMPGRQRAGCSARHLEKMSLSSSWRLSLAGLFGCYTL